MKMIYRHLTLLCCSQLLYSRPMLQTLYVGCMCEYTLQPFHDGLANRPPLEHPG